MEMNQFLKWEIQRKFNLLKVLAKSQRFRFKVFCTTRGVWRYNLHIYKIYIVLDILDEQAELNEKIMEVEKSRLEATLNLLSSKMEVAKEFRVTKEIYGEMISNENGNYLKLYLLSFIFIIFIKDVFITLLKNMYNPLFCLIDETQNSTGFDLCYHWPIEKLQKVTDNRINGNDWPL